MDHSVNAGLDGSYFWAFNYLVSHDYQNLDKITFIYGPLAFLHNPMYYSPLVIIGLLYQIILKLAYGIAMLNLAQHLNVSKKVTFAAFAASCLTIFNIEAISNLSVILFLMLYHFEKKNSHWFAIAFFTISGYFFKCSAGLSAAVLQGLFYLHYCFTNKSFDYKLFLRIVGINVAFFLVIGLLLFHSLVPVFESIPIYVENIKSFNETSSIYNGNDNIVLLTLSGLALIAIFYYNNNSTFKLFWILALFFAYTGYTHSIVRMDHSHYMGFLVYLYLIACCSILFYQNQSKYTFPLLGISFFSYYSNVNGKRDFQEFYLSLPNGPANFTEYVFNAKNHNAKCKRQSAKNLKFTNKLNANIINEINKGTVDFFPWDFGFVEANNLKNWKPRHFLQSLNMSPYFDKKTADYFKSDQAPDYLLWHGGNSIDFMNGIDDSYFMNNEFYSICSILSNYEISSKQSNLLILKRRNTPIKVWVKDDTETLELKNGEWIKLPENKNSSGCSVEYDFNLLRGLKKQFYRDDEFFIEYKTSTNQKFKRRIWPSDAKNFIWLNPFISNLNDSSGFKTVTEVRFTNTNSVIHSGKLKIRFKSLMFESQEAIDSKTALYKWFGW